MKIEATSEGYEQFFGVFIKRRVDVGCLAVGDVRSVRHSNVWSICEAVQRRGFVHKEDGASIQCLKSGETVQEGDGYKIEIFSQDGFLVRARGEIRKFC